MRYLFTLEIENLDLRDEAAVERFYEAEAEAYLSARDGRVDVTYVVEAPPGDPCDAVLDATNHLRELLPGVVVTRLALDLVRVTDIAARVDRPRATVRSWTTGTRGPGGFPRPLATLSGGVRVWHWPEVNEWLHVHHPEIADEERGIPLDAVERINHALSSRNASPARDGSPPSRAATSRTPRWRTARKTCIKVRRHPDVSLPDHPYLSRTPQ
ncbi:hypothetical protein GCM10027160_04360 [Streptomyces calidiresistens]